MRPRLRYTPVLLLLLLLGACDSGDPVDEPAAGDVAGTYDFTEFYFQPSGSGIQPISVLDTLVQGETNLRLASNGNFILSFEFIDGDLYFPTGSFSVSDQSIRLNGNDDFRDQFERILLSDELTLRRSDAEPDILTADITKTINPSEFSDRYSGVPQATGTLRLRLEKR